jgi:hypothetical protein
MTTSVRVRAVGVVLLGVALIAVPVAVKAGGSDARLNGDYAFVQTRVCSQGAPGAPGIDEHLVLLSPNSTRTTAVRGVMGFDGRGGGALRFDELQLNASVTGTGQQQTGGTTGTCGLGYAVDADGHVVIDVLGCTATGVSGVVAGQHFTASDSSLEGALSADGKTLLLSDVAAHPSTVTTVETGLVSTRVCSRNGTAVRIR